MGGYEDWLRQKQGRRAARPRAKSAQAGRRSSPRPGPRRASFKEKRELGELPGRIEKLEAEREGLFAKMASPGFHATHPREIAAATQRLAAVEDEIHRAFTRWTELETLVSEQVD